METLYEIGVYADDVQDYDWEMNLSHGFTKMKKRVHALAKKNPNHDVLAQPYDPKHDCAYGGTYSVKYVDGKFEVINCL